MKPMQPINPMKPMSGGEKWWPPELGEPTSSGSQNSLHYAFFSATHQLLIERDGELARYDTGDRRISGVQQSGGDATPVFTSDDGAVRLDELKQID